MRRAVVIINPVSGRGQRAHQLAANAALASNVLGEHGYTVDVKVTTGPGDAMRLAKEAVDNAAALVVAWGGDGTVNEVASALVHTDVPLAIVPAGSGNGLALDLGVPLSVRKALTLAGSGRDFRIDAGQVDGALFFNIAGVGIDAIVAARFAQRGRRRGALAYLQIAFDELMHRRTERYEICVEDERAEYHALLVAIANGRQYGNNVCIAPEARLDDGRLELVIVEQQSLFSIVRRLPALFLGRLKPGGGVTMRSVRELRVRAERPIPYHVDGEPRLGPQELTVSVLPGALVVRAPMKSSKT
jgi:YegS/Rv2252/BmrU family lipid kinase